MTDDEDLPAHRSGVERPLPGRSFTDDLANMMGQMEAGRSHPAHPDEVGNKADRIASDNGRTRALRALGYANPGLGVNVNIRVGQYDWGAHDRALAAEAAAVPADEPLTEADLDIAPPKPRGDVIDTDATEL